MIGEVVADPRGPQENVEGEEAGGGGGGLIREDRVWERMGGEEDRAINGEYEKEEGENEEADEHRPAATKGDLEVVEARVGDYVVVQVVETLGRT